jgi:hypothetical protein
MRIDVGLWFGVGLLGLLPAGAAADKPITAEEATKKFGEKVLVEMVVRASKERLEKFGEIYLDSEEDFRSPKNLGVVITKAGAAAFANAGIKDPATHFKGKTIRVSGTVSEKDKKFRLIVEDPKQIEVVEKK